MRLHRGGGGQSRSGRGQQRGEGVWRGYLRRLFLRRGGEDALLRARGFVLRCASALCAGSCLCIGRIRGLERGRSRGLGCRRFLRRGGLVVPGARGRRLSCWSGRVAFWWAWLDPGIEGIMIIINYFSAVAFGGGRMLEHGDSWVGEGSL